MKLLLVDGNSILNRAFYGVKPLSNSRGLFTNAVYGFFNILLRAVGDVAPDDVVIAFDRREPTFRHKAVASYKANRKGMPEELAQQLPYTQKLLTAMGYAVVTCAGWEADDILGTLSAACDAAGAECVILTGDRDNLQLITDRVTVRLATNKEPIPYDRARFEADYGFPPHALIDLKALMGDSSDNISGVQGIGEKTANALIRQYGSIEALYAALGTDEFKPAVRKKLEAGEADAKQSKWLATIVTDAPIPTELSAYARKPEDTEALSALLTELELYKLMERLHVAPAAASAAAEPAAESAAVTLPEQVPYSAELLAAACSSEAPVDFLLRGNILYLAAAGKMFRVTDPSAIMRFLTCGVRKRSFAAKPVYRMCMEQGKSLQNLTLDAELCAYLLNPSVPEYAIARLCAGASLPYPAESGEFADIAALPALCDTLEQQVIAEGMESLLREIELPLTEVLADMEHTGIRVDAAGVRAFGDRLSAEIAQLEAAIYTQAGREFNILSPKQLGVLLFEELRLPAGKKTKTGWSTNAEVLEAIQDQHPIVGMILQYRQLTKLNSTYVEGLLRAIQPDGRIHTCFRQTETRTGRISSTEPNLQNIPVRTPLGREMRKFFISAPGQVLLDADYSQIELRLVAHLCGDEHMQRSFIEERDIHRTTAAQVFNMPEEMVTKEMRSAAKAVNFGILYGIGAYSLSRDLGITVAKADRYIKDYLHSFPRVEQFMDDTVARAKERGYVTTMFGRKRFVPELKMPNKNVQAAGRRIAMNTPVQGTAADIIKLAMVRVWRRLRAEVPSARLILQIHDELIVEAPKADADRAAAILQTEMEGACKLSVPLTAEVEQGESWYDAKG